MCVWLVVRTVGDSTTGTIPIGLVSVTTGLGPGWHLWSVPQVLLQRDGYAL